MKKSILKITLSIILSGLFFTSNAQLISPPTGPWDTPIPNIFETTTFSGVGIGTNTPRAWQEILYCNPQNNNEVGLTVTRKECASTPLKIWTLPDIIGGGLNVVPWNGEVNNTDPLFTLPPNSFFTGSGTSGANPLFPNSEAPLFWVRTENTTPSNSNIFNTKLVVMPGGNVGINIALPRAALDVRGSNAINRPAAIIGSRAMGTHVTDPATQLTKFFTQQVHFVPRLSGNGYNQITIANDQGMFFTDGQGTEGANLNGSFVLGPWANNADPNVGGMRMDNLGNTEFHGTVRATKIDIDATWWSDFVFAPSYEMITLFELETFINANKHLPNIPSEKEVLKNGIDVANMQALQLQKIEELTLYTIEQEKKINTQEEKLAIQQKKLEELETLLLQVLNK